MRLRTTLQLHGKNATGIELPASVMETLAGKRPKVTVTINGFSYPSSVGTMAAASSSR